MRGLSRHLRGALVIGALVSVLVGSSRPASAHHGWGGNEDALSDMTGIVASSVSLAGPHATMKITAEGRVWDLTLAPPARTSAAGLKEGAIPVGTTVKVHGNRNRDPKRFEMKVSRLTWDGKVFNVYPDRD
jgi:hypothetical protein